LAATAWAACRLDGQQGREKRTVRLEGECGGDAQMKVSRGKEPVFVFQYWVCGSLQPLLVSKIKFIFILLTELSFNGSRGDSTQNRFPMESVLSGTVCGVSPDNPFSLPWAFISLVTNSPLQTERGNSTPCSPAAGL